MGTTLTLTKDRMTYHTLMIVYYDDISKEGRKGLRIFLLLPSDESGHVFFILLTYLL